MDGENMGQAREVMDRVTEAVFVTKDRKAAEQCYAVDCVGITPDAGRVTGREAVVDYTMGFVDAFPDLTYEYVAKHESGDCAIDEGLFRGTNTAPLRLPNGDTIPATGKQVTARGCDICQVRDGVIVEHRFYYDQVELLSRLGLLPDTAG